MSTVQEIKVPDIGDFKGVEIIEILVSPGDSISPEDPLISLESDKATMEVPSPAGGTVAEIKVKVGDKVSEGDLILTLEAAEDAGGDAAEDAGGDAAAQEAPKEDKKQAAPAPEKTEAKADSKPESKPSPRPAAEGDVHAEVVVLGSGPGGYSAAFRAADLGKKTVLVERYETLGGVCLNVGCIPSKALLHAAKVIAETREMAENGIVFGEPSIDLAKLAGWKNTVVGKLTKGLSGLAKQRKVEVLTGVGSFMSPNQLAVETASGRKVVSFDNAIIAAGSQAAQIPGFPYDDPRVIDSTGALELDGVPKRMLVVGGGIIGLEMADVYSALGAKITVVELLDGLMPGTDRDLVRPYQKFAEKDFENVFLSTKVTKMTAEKEGIRVAFEGKNAPAEDMFDKVLVAVGRSPNGKKIGAENAGINVDERGFIAVDKQQRTNVSHIFAIGDIVGQPMLAHKSVHEGKVAAEVAAGLKSSFDAKVIPSVAYTDPEVAWVGVTETEAKEKKIKYGKGVFPWAASGRSLALSRDEGMTKLLFDEETDMLIGAGIVGPNAGDLIAEAALAIEMGCDATDIGLTIHPHPTLSETIGFSAEAFEGTITDLYMPKKKK